MNLLVLGPQGSGKGTQAKRIAEDHGVPHVSTGDMFRAAIADATPLGKEVKAVLDSGALVSDELTIALVEERLGLEDAAPGFVLDGFPRTLAQAEALDALLSRHGRELDGVLFFDLSDELATERISGRAAAEGRTDDTPEVIATRLALYHEQTEPLVEHYRAAGVLITLHAERTIDEVHAEISAALALIGERDMIIRKGAAELERIARAGELVAATIAHVGERIEPGITTAELDDIADAFILAAGGSSASRGYRGYPASICISPNDVVVHGIPGGHVVAEGDLDHDRRRGRARRRDRRQRLHLRRRRGRAGGAAAARRLPGGARGRHRAGDRREPDR